MTNFLLDALLHLGIYCNTPSDVQERDGCDPFKHQWKEVYYGLRCAVCGEFVADGCGPWMPIDDDLDDDDDDDDAGPSVFGLGYSFGEDDFDDDDWDEDPDGAEAEHVW